MGRNAETLELFDSADLDAKMVEAQYKNAVGYLKIGEIELANQAAQRVLKIDADHPPTHALLELIKQEYFIDGLTLVKENKISEGIRSFQSAVTIDSTFVDAYCEIGRALLKQGKLDEAEKAAKKVLRLDSNSESAHEFLEKIKRIYCKRARTYLRQGKFPSAEKAIGEALRLDSDYELAHELLERIKCAYYDKGIIFLGQDRCKKAIANFKSALAIDERFIKAYCGITNAHLGLGELASAEETVKDILRLDSNYRPARELATKIKYAYYDRACVCLKQDEFENAKKAIKEVLRFDSSRKMLLKIKDTYCDQGRIYIKRGKFDFATRMAEEVSRLDSSDETANELLEKIKMGYCKRGDSFLRRGWYKTAISTFEKALEIDPDFTKAYCGIASVHLDQRALAHAAEIVRKVLCLDSEYEPAHELLDNTRDAYYDHAYECFKQDKFTDAEKAATETLRLDSSHDPARELLEEVKHIYQAQGTILLKRDEKADSYFHKANAIDANFTVTGLIKAYCRLGHFYLVHDELELAKVAVDEALCLDSEHESTRVLLERIKYMHCDRGFEFLDKNRYDEAIIYFRNVLSMDTNFTEAYCGIVLAYLGQGKLANLKKVVDGVLWNNLGYESDREFLEEMKLTDYTRGIDLLNQNQYDETITCFENLLSMDMNFMEARCGIALAYLGQDELEAAEQAISEVLWSKSNYEYDSASAILEDIKQTYYNRAVTFLNEYQYSEAVTDFENAIAIDVGFTEACVGLRDAYIGFGSVYFGQLDVTEEDAGEIDVISRVSEPLDFLTLVTQLTMQAAALIKETEFSESSYGWQSHDDAELSLSTDVVETLNMFDTVYETLCQELQREPRQDEIIEALDLTEEEVEEILMFNAISMDSPLSNGYSTETLGDLIEDSTSYGGEVPIIHMINEDLIFQYLQRLPEIRGFTNSGENDSIAKMVNSDLICQCFEKLPEVEQKMLKMRFGLGDGEHKTHQEISITLKVPREQVRQLEIGAIKRLRILYEEEEEFQPERF